MKAKGIIFAILFIMSVSALSQESWHYSDYDSINHTNFRSYSAFYQKVNISNPDYALLNAVLFFITNEERVKNKKTPFLYHKSLEIAAYNHSKEMAKGKFLSHINHKNKKRRNTKERALLAGINNPFIAENVLYNFFSPNDTYLQIAEKLIEQWMNSPTHRKNILSEDGIQCGCGAFFRDDYVYATQNFQWFYPIFEKNAVDKLPQTIDGERISKRIDSQ
jgi:uncharacterized protein YkwD